MIASSAENESLSRIPERGCLLGIDPGSVRIGLADTDVNQSVSIPLQTYTLRTRILDESFFQDLKLKHTLVGCVVGLPIHLSGQEGDKAKAARKFAAWLSRVLQLPVDFVDERYSSVEAWNRLKSGGLKAAQRKKLVDKVAAQLLLQAFLDSRQGAQKQASLTTQPTDDTAANDSTSK